MGYKTADRVKDTSTTTGTGNVTVSGTPPQSYKTFSARLSVGDTFPYVIEHQSADEWESGRGTWLGSNQFSRDKVYESSNSDALVDFTAGTKNCFIDIPAKRLRADEALPLVRMGII